LIRVVFYVVTLPVNGIVLYYIYLCVVTIRAVIMEEHSECVKKGKFNTRIHIDLVVGMRSPNGTNVFINLELIENSCL